MGLGFGSSSESHTSASERLEPELDKLRDAGAGLAPAVVEAVAEEGSTCWEGFLLTVDLALLPVAVWDDVMLNSDGGLVTLDVAVLV